MGEHVTYRRIRGRIVPIRRRKKKEFKKEDHILASTAGVVAAASVHRITDAFEKRGRIDAARIRKLRKKAVFSTRRRSMVERILRRDFPEGSSKKVMKKKYFRGPTGKTAVQPDLFTGAHLSLIHI